VASRMFAAEKKFIKLCPYCRLKSGVLTLNYRWSPNVKVIQTIVGIGLLTE
jgi:hypothetical protein